MIQKPRKISSITFLIICLVTICLFFPNILATEIADFQENIPPFFQDSFDDNIYNSTTWEKIEVNGGKVTENNGQLQVTGPYSDLSWADWYWSQAGYVTRYSFDANWTGESGEGFEASVNVVDHEEVSEMVLLVSDEKITDRDPLNATNWYMINKVLHTKYPFENLTRVVSRIDGNVSWLVEAPWLSSTGELKIRVSDGSIAFFENGLFRHSEPFSFNSTQCYIYVYTSKWGQYSGTGCFDDFLVQNVRIYPDSTRTPNPTGLPTPTTKPSPTLRSVPTLDFNCTSTTTINDFEVQITGSLTYNCNSLADQPILISYSVTNGQTWQSLTCVKTQLDGSFAAIWKPQVTGNYLLKATFEATPELADVSKIITLVISPDLQDNIFTLSSNSTITRFGYNMEDKTLTFTAEGPTGTHGYVNIEIPKTVLNEVSDLKVYLDNSEMVYSSTSAKESWLIFFTYPHSSHEVTLALGSGAINPSEEQYEPKDATILILISTILVVLAVVITITHKYKTK